MNDNNSLYPIGKKRIFMPFELNEKWGYFNQNGDVTIHPIFDETDVFSEGLAGIKISDYWGYIDYSGSVVIEPEFIFVGPFNENSAIVKSIEGHFLLINQTGMKVKFITETFEIDEPIEQATAKGELIRVKRHDLIGYINHFGDVVISPQFAEGGSFSNGLAWVKSITGEYFYINSFGEIVIRLSTNYIPDSFSEGLAAIRDVSSLKSGVIDKNGDLIIDFKLMNPDYFSEGISSIIVDGKMSYINSSGQLLLTGRYEEALPFINGLALVSIEDRSAFINKDGQVVTPYQKYDYVDVQSYLLDSNLVLVLQDGRYKYINKNNGECVFEIN